MVLSQTVLTEPSLLHWHAERHGAHDVCPQHVGSFPPQPSQPWGAQAPLRAGVA